MGRPKRQTGRLAALVLLSLATAPAIAQEAPLSLTGTVGTGYFRHETRLSTLNSSPLHLQLRASGYLGHPDFLSFWANPTLGFGTQNSQFGFNGADGFSTGFSLMRRRAFPLHFRYARFDSARNLNIGDPLLNSTFANNRSEWSLSSAVRIPGFQPLQLRYESTENRRSREAEGPLDFRRRRREFTAELGKIFKGWRWTGDWSRFTQKDDTLLLSGGTFLRDAFSTSRRQGSSSLLSPSIKGTKFILSWARTDISSGFGFEDLDLNSDGATLEARSRWSERLQTQLRFTKRGSLTERFLPPVQSGAPSVLLGLNEADTRDLTGSASYRILPRLSVVGNFSSIRSDAAVHLPGQTLEFGTRGELGGAGLDFSQPIPRGLVRADYRLTRNSFRQGAINGLQAPQDRETIGHNFSVQLSQHNVATFDQMIGRFSYSTEDPGESGFSVQNQMSLQYQAERHVGLLRLFGTVGYGKAEAKLPFDLESKTLSYSLNAANHLFNFNYTHNGSDQSVLVSGTGGLPPAGFETRTTESHGDNFTAHIYIWRAIPIHFQWSRHSVEVDGLGVGTFRAFLVRTSYQLGFLTLDTGISLNKSTGGVLSGLSNRRNDYFFRVERRFVIF